MEAGGALPAGSGRTVRLDPFTLPVRFPARDAGADGQMRQVELDRDRVVLRRAVRGMRMKIRLAVDAFVGITLVPAGEGPAASIILDHADPALSVPLLDQAPLDEAIVMWRAWGRVLGLSLWQRGADGDVRQVCPGPPFAANREGYRPQAPPLHHQETPAVDPDAAQARTAYRPVECASRRARDHRAELGSRLTQRRVEDHAGEQDQSGIAIGLEQAQA